MTCVWSIFVASSNLGPFLVDHVEVRVTAAPRRGDGRRVGDQQDRPSMWPESRRVDRSDLVHAADYPLAVTAVNRSEFSAHISDEDGMVAFLASVTRSPVATSTV